MGSYDFDEVENAIEIGEAEVAKVLCGGELLTGGIYDEGYWLLPCPHPAGRHQRFLPPGVKDFIIPALQHERLPYEAALFMRNSQKRYEAV